MIVQTLALTLVLLVSALGRAHACGPVLVSGYDDVLRQADNTGLLRAARRLLTADVTYAGMLELYQILSCPGSDPPMYVVSATPSALTSRARAFLARSGYPASRLYFRRGWLQWSPERFKQARIERLLSAHPDRRFVFVFDNSPTSVRLSQGLLQAHPTRIAAVYLRETVKRDLPSRVIPFITAFDIAAREFTAGRITAIDTARVAEAILAERDANQVIPGYSYCPVTSPPCAFRNADVADQCRRVREHVQRICAARRHRQRVER